MTTVERPDWVTETPNESLYLLSMNGGDGFGVQDIEVTRDEFIALKARLAELRGFETEQRDASTRDAIRGYLDSVDAQLRKDFESFLKRGGAFEKTFLADLFQMRDAIALPSAPIEQAPLISMFEQLALDREDELFRVPASLQPALLQYVEHIQEHGPETPFDPMRRLQAVKNGSASEGA